MERAPAPPSPSSSSASVPMVVITVVGIFAAFALLASYYAFVTKCQLFRAALSRNPPWRGHRRARWREGRPEASTVIRTVEAADRGLAPPFIRMLPVVKFAAAAAEDGGVAGGRVSVSTECAVCLSEFVERERVRLLPNCAHAFHIDCIDTWLQGSARCPFCRSDVTLPPAPSNRAWCADDDDHRRDEGSNDSDSIVTEVRGEQESWSVAPAAAAGGRRLLRKQQRRRKAESVGDEAIDTRKKDEEFAVQPMRRSLSMDSSCANHLYVLR